MTATLPAAHPELLLKLDAGVLTLTMNRPDRRNALTAGMGMEVMVLVFIVIIIGGLGSVGGCFIGAILVAIWAKGLIA